MFPKGLLVIPSIIFAFFLSLTEVRADYVRIGPGGFHVGYSLGYGVPDYYPYQWMSPRVRKRLRRMRRMRARQRKRRLRRKYLRKYGRDRIHRRDSRAARNCLSGKRLAGYLSGRLLKGKSRTTGRVWRAAFYPSGSVRYTYASGNHRSGKWALRRNHIRIRFSKNHVAIKKVCKRNRRFVWVDAGTGRASSSLLASTRLHKKFKRKRRLAALDRSSHQVRRAEKRSVKKRSKLRASKAASQSSSKASYRRAKQKKPIARQKKETPSYLPPGSQRFETEENVLEEKNEEKRSELELEKKTALFQTNPSLPIRKLAKRDSFVSPVDTVEGRIVTETKSKSLINESLTRQPLVNRSLKASERLVKAPGTINDLLNDSPVSENLVKKTPKGKERGFFDVLSSEGGVATSKAGELKSAKADRLPREGADKKSVLPRKGLASIVNSNSRASRKKQSSQKIVRLEPEKISVPKAVSSIRRRLVTGKSDGGWAAVAYTPDGRFVVATRQDNIKDARNVASSGLFDLHDGPHRMVTVGNIQCAAISEDSDGKQSRIFVNRGSSLIAAQKTALQRCRLNRKGGQSSCSIRYWFCADGRVSSNRL